MPYTIIVEKLRLIAYACFWGTIVVGVVLTSAFADIDTDDTLLLSVYGFNNVCVNFDFAPATYVLPALWAITMVFFIAYFLGQTVLISTHGEEGLITARLCKVLKVMKGFEMITFCLFSIIFAVSPEGPDHTMWVHTIPWVGLQLGLVSVALSNTMHGIHSGTIMLYPFTDEQAKKLAIGYNVLLITVVIVNQLLTFNALTGMSTCVARDNGTGWDDCEGGFITKSDGLATLFRTMSFLFFTLTAIVPPLKAGLLLYGRTDRLEKVILDFRLLENKHVKKHDDAIADNAPSCYTRVPENATLCQSLSAGDVQLRKPAAAVEGAAVDGYGF